MARRFTRGVTRGRSQRRESTWLFLTSTATTFTAAGGVLLNSLNAAALALRPFTVIRTYLDGNVVSDQSAGGENQHLAIGLAVVSDQAVAAGVGSVPTPVTERGSDLWLLHQEFAGSGSAVNDGRVGFQIKADSKAMRRVDEGSDLIVVAELDSVLSDGFVLRLAGRILIKLH